MSREWKRDELVEAIAAGAFALADNPELSVKDVVEILATPEADAPSLGPVCSKGFFHEGPCES